VGNIREAPSLEAPVKFQLKRNDAVQIVKAQNEWRLIHTDGKAFGWAHESILADNGAATPRVAAISDAPEKKRVIRTETGNVRAAPDTGAEVIRKLRKGDAVKALSTKGAWYRVNLADGTEGWAHQAIFYDATGDDTATHSQRNTISSLQVETKAADEERVLVHINGFSIPETFVIDGKKPRVVCDFKGIRLGQNIRRQINAGGKWIDQVRVGTDDDDKQKVRIVLDLQPDHNYQVEQNFYKKEGLYVLTVRMQ